MQAPGECGQKRSRANRQRRARLVHAGDAEPRANHTSCIGTPNATNTTRAPEALISAITSSSSRGLKYPCRCPATLSAGQFERAVRGGIFSDAGLTAKEENRDAAECKAPAKWPKKVSPVEIVTERSCIQFRRQRYAGSIRQKCVDIVERVSIAPILMCEIGAMRVEKSDLSRRAGLGAICDPIDSFSHAGLSDVESEHLTCLEMTFWSYRGPPPWCGGGGLNLYLLHVRSPAMRIR